VYLIRHIRSSHFPIFICNVEVFIHTFRRKGGTPYISDGEVQSPFLGLKLVHDLELLGVRNFLVTSFGSEDFGRTVFRVCKKRVYLSVLNFISDKGICSVS